MKEVISILVSIVVIGGAFFGAAYYAKSRQCAESYSSMQPQYSFWAGCTIMTKEGRIPSRVFRIIE